MLPAHDFVTNATTYDITAAKYDVVTEISIEFVTDGKYDVITYALFDVVTDAKYDVVSAATYDVVTDVTNDFVTNAKYVVVTDVPVVVLPDVSLDIGIASSNKEVKNHVPNVEDGHLYVLHVCPVFIQTE